VEFCIKHASAEFGRILLKMSKTQRLKLGGYRA
jgi:hypothetical protein